MPSVERIKDDGENWAKSRGGIRLTATAFWCCLAVHCGRVAKCHLPDAVMSAGCDFRLPVCQERRGCYTQCLRIAGVRATNPVGQIVERDHVGSRNLLERPRRDRGAYTYLFVLFLIDSTVESLDKFGGSNSQAIANAQQRPNGDRPPRLDLLPMASREAKPNHVFLRIPFSLPQLSHTLAEGAKELSFINHVQLCKRVSSGAPRAD
jgi:hypothetical protein